MQPSVTRAAAFARRELRAHARPARAFDVRRYFRATDDVEFLNTGTPFVRALGVAIAREHRTDWTVDDALAFADRVMRDRCLEVKGVGIEVLARFQRAFTPALLPTWKRWLVRNDAANWATTDSICGSLIGPMLAAHPAAVPIVAGWTSHRNLWVRRAAAVSLVRLAARGQALDDAYEVARRLTGDPHDLIHKAVGWLLREAGKADADRLERYLREHGPSVPRTTVRYAIERFPPTRRRALLLATRGPRPA